MAETAGSVQFGLTFSPLDRALQPSTEETLERVEEESNDRDEQMEAREDAHTHTDTAGCEARRSEV